ncbi:MAG: restriction endonuclease subunit S [Paludibacteraceae bacterium]|nr:restriction endonuclease subunit S [Paludibacteraceae bacterium]
MTEWKEYKLGDVCSRLSSGKGIKSDFITTQGKYPVWGGNGVRGYTNTSNFSGRCCIIGRQGAYCGNVHFFEGDAYMTEHAVVAVGNELADSYFLACQLSLMHLENLSAQSAQPGISVKTLSNQIVSLPPLETQRRIAAILSSIDDKIDLLHRENATLEQMAETLFRQWFVVEAKEEWEEKPLGNVVKTTSGGTPSRKHSEYYENGTINWVKSKELNGSFISATEELITKEAVAKSSAKMLPEKSVLIAMYGATVGEYGILSKPMTCNQAVCALIPNENYPYTYLYVWTALMKEDFINLASGAAQQNISQDLIKQQIVCSDLDKIKQYDEMVRGYFEKMENNQKQIITLTETRDGLLGRLMSGEIKL